MRRRRTEGRVLHALAVAALVVAFAGRACAAGESYEGHSGAVPAPASAPVVEPLPRLDPVTPPAVAAPVPVSVAQPVAVEAAPVPVDPCAAYMASYNAYVVCQDRMQKIQRMKDAKAKRNADFKARYEPPKKPAAPNSATPPAGSAMPPAPPDDGKAVPPANVTLVPDAVNPPVVTTTK